ncbi:MAG: alpha/beta hydrolase [Anaerolineales bacterium]
MITKKQLVFPAFNALIGIFWGAAIGYYVYSILGGVIVGALTGFVIGVLIEALAVHLGSEHWLYRRRVLLTAVLEIPLALLTLGPFVYLLASVQASPHSIRCEPPTAFGAANSTTVEIGTEDGIMLSGWYVPPQSTQPGPVLVLLHGAKGDRCQMTWHAQHLLAAGYGVLMMDTRATGESTGDQTAMGWREGEDMLALLDFLTARPEVDAARIGVVGSSAGAHMALNGAYLAPGRMAALWLDGLGPQRMADFPEPENFQEKFVTAINARVLRLAEWYFREPAPPAYVDILAGLDEPQIMLVTGELEAFEHTVNLKYAAAAGENVGLWVVEGGYHCSGPVTSPEAYAQNMLAFFERTLGEE